MDERRKRELFDTADRLLGETGRVSLRTLNARLRRSGSNREIGPALAEWKALRDYQPRLKAKPLPVPLQDGLARVAGELWAAAQAAAAAALARDRANLEAKRAAGEAVLAEALDRLDAAEAENAALCERLARAEARLDGAEGRLERKRAEEFWDRVMREIYALLPETGAMSAAQIIRLLKPATVRGAADFREPMTPRTLHKKMTGRAQQGWYFEAAKAGFSRGTFPTLGRSKAPAPAA